MSDPEIPEDAMVQPGCGDDDLVEEADEESFPASDSPASGRFD